MTRDCDSFPKGLQCKSFDSFVNSTRLGVDRVKPCNYTYENLFGGG